MQNIIEYKITYIILKIQLQKLIPNSKGSERWNIWTKTDVNFFFGAREYHN